MRKEEVRQKAVSLGFKVAQKPDSQEICFVRTNYRDFLKERYPEQIRPGHIRDLTGKILGKHPGLPFFTIGQREGLRIGGKRPYYVVRLDSTTNEVWVGREEDLLFQELMAGDVNFIPFDSLERPMRARVKVRYSQESIPSTLIPMEDGRVLVRFNQPQRATAPGQAAVFYDDDDPELLLGGGTIVAPITEAFKDHSVSTLA